MDNAVQIRKKRRWKNYKVFLFALPGIIIVSLFEYVPLWGWSFSLFEYRPALKLSNSEFVGLANFTALFGNPILRANLFRVIRNTVGMHLLGYLFSPLPMFFAVFLTEIKSKYFQKTVQSLTTLPHFISWVIMLSLATSLFGVNGLVNVFFREIGLDVQVNILTSPNNVWITQVLLQTWKGIGWSSIIYFAAITGIDQEIYEAAMVDGAGRWAKIWFITLPLLIPTYFVLLVMGIGNFLNSGIDQFLAFGNALNKESIETLDLYVYNLGIGSGQISFSVAVGIMKTGVALLLFAGANFASKKIRGTSVF